MKINGVDIEQEFGIQVINVEGNMLPDFRPETVEIPGMGIKYVNKNEVLSLTKTVYFVIKRNSKSSLLSDLKEFLLFLNPFDAEKTINFDNETGYRVGVISGSSFDEKKFAGNVVYNVFRIDFTFFEPYQYALEEEMITINAAINTEYTITNDGLEIPFEVEMRSQNETATDISLYINDDYLKYLGSLAVNDVLTIDTGNFTIVKNGINVIKDTEGLFMNLQAGNNIIKVTGNFVNNLNLKFSFRKRWL